VRALVRLARPEHWIKNVIVLLPVVFAQKMGDPRAWGAAALAALAFCLASSAAYIINDIQDREKDRLHPRKKDRPLASGEVSPGAAAGLAAGLLAAGLAIAFRAGAIVLLIVAAYLVLQAAYTFFLKHKMIVDVICIALGFVLRATAGAVALHVEVSPWLFVCTFTICLFMGFCKRRNETADLRDAEQAEKHRKTLIGYTPELLTHLITLSAGVAVIAFLLYATSSRTVEHFGTDYLVYTLPAVLYGICRFAMLSMRGRFADPTDLILHDWPFQVSVAAWSVAAVILIGWGRELQAWLAAHY
jgi:4-hydroxybenzoate polyprenyltransferase